MHPFELIRILALVTIGILMFFGLFHMKDLLDGIGPLRKKGREGKKPDEGRRNAIIILYTIMQLMIAAMLFLFIKLILRGEL
ncbi:MAG TPA: hypothetical protein GXX75_25885 [Clostridiales bacterium]|nr:hypothetical protein [Clostridiales bacterium]